MANPFAVPKERLFQAPDQGGYQVRYDDNGVVHWAEEGSKYEAGEIITLDSDGVVRLVSQSAPVFLGIMPPRLTEEERQRLFAHVNSQNWLAIPERAERKLFAFDAAVDARFALLLDLFAVAEDELPLIRAVLLGDADARGKLADMLDDKGAYARADRVRNPGKAANR